MFWLYWYPYKGHRCLCHGNWDGNAIDFDLCAGLIVDYGVKKKLIPGWGTAGSLNEDFHVRELVFGAAANEL